MTEKSQIRVSADEYRRLPETNQPTELIGGQVVVSPSPISDHQRVVRRLSRLIEDNMPSGEVMLSPMDVYFGDANVLQPDVFWLAEDSACIERDGYFYGPPELVVEVLSPATSTRDKREKFDVYEASGVREYWIVDVAGEHIEVWTLGGASFQRQGVYVVGNGMPSSILGQTLTLPDLFG
ncbi:MAG: Uma2 family endonuclease [Chloroflexota bacterium]